jgi:LacI family transcriptional regulator
MQAASELLKQDNPPSAIFACNDDMAAGAIAAAHQAGMSVPQDVTVVGFDDTANASAAWPPLTTIRQPIREMARTSIEILSRSVAHKVAQTNPKPEKVTLDYDLVIRDSAAAPKQND